MPWRKKGGVTPSPSPSSGKDEERNYGDASSSKRLIRSAAPKPNFKPELKRRSVSTPAYLQAG